MYTGNGFELGPTIIVIVIAVVLVAIFVARSRRKK